MRKREYMNPALLFALTGMALLSSATFAQPPGQILPAGSADQARPNSSTGTAASPSGTSPAGAITLKLMDVLITAYPSVTADMQHNDNIYSTPKNKTGDRILVLTPALRLETKQAGNVFGLRMSSAIGEYQNNKSDNYTNTSLNGLANLNLGTRLRARLEAEYLDGLDPRGSTNNPLSTTPDHYRQTRGQGIFSYGAQGARGHLDLELGQVRREYLNNRATTVASDRVIDNLGATFYWRVGPKTTLLFQGKHSRVDYVLSTSTLGSMENAFLAGATWEASAKTSGTFRFGVTKKDFDDSARGSSTGISWTGQVRWSPRTYSHVDLNLNRAPAETSGGVGNFIDRTSTGARWTHAWSTTFTTEALASYLTDAYQGAARTDNTQDYGLRATYKMRRWLSFGGNYAHTIRSSDDSNFDYKRNVFMLFLNATL
ncbi:MAG: outer membrane beta-barrel protein [Betaproteobacteria bacterium]|nr:outer membrane beta-barrel protein [Betaproteobacteria bacterium]